MMGIAHLHGIAQVMAAGHAQLRVHGHAPAAAALQLRQVIGERCGCGVEVGQCLSII